jgi:hypothetical protein
VGISILPLPRGAFGLALPARFEWLPIQDWRPGARGSLTLAVRGGTRVLLVEPFGCTSASPQPSCGLSSAGGVLGETGIAFRSGADSRQALPFEIAFSGLIGPILPYAGARREMAGIYAGAAMSLGEVF